MNKQGTILIVDDNRNILTTVKMLLEDTFARITAIASPNNIPARLREDRPDVVLLDMNFQSGINNGNEGLYWLREIKRLRPQTQVVLFTAYADIELAVTGIKEGAADFVIKPFDNRKMRETLLNAYHKVTPRPQTAGKSNMVWGSSAAMTDLKVMVEKVAGTDANILITGENGTGKEVLANEIHLLSQRSDARLMPIDMGAVSETLFESELFGHMKGAFTDAKADKPGKFELAEGGTLFLDEIGNLSYNLQAKLLTALQRRSIVRVGGSRQIPINVRLICATNRDLQQMVREGSFREDLLYRINTIHLHLPALRERQGDIVPLARIFLERYAGMYNKSQMRFSPAAERKIDALPWYGNIRELQHAVEKAVILTDGPEIGESDIDGDTPATSGRPEGAQTIDQMEQRLIEKTIADCDGNLSQVASRLGISRQTLYNKIKRYGL
ncbi:sigma-54-dependent transcriptional regulator [Prevotella sp. kh1p2]|uniref:sigma-54-dependent transcriptional regulator n=1 Tax=Prevotella sp. kh1p2 TaxID=1761883 RepID=UPI0008BF3B7F|nr:sigma-54 dependent transcriptional regulator [Prevotella sp. kh1p2]SES91938.1 DNA-binding transcriptional response regulator, NtrC family, contains REC, AAA-type ATPase, and a Fis-type DNA-binding domains [Prevotella sp. kh1p2]SNU11152.1 DNA-binding transcriptional response regulator, NtrC family, contains REC, AAA-type ATPase, and a Fis-type DNA-binding domains [Prevotellaceae bacterium KH2P17]